MIMLKVFHIDAFTDKVFGGNTACVIPLDFWLKDTLLQKIATENAVSETAFFVRKKNDIELRWFTPEFEIDLCGHGTLATAHCLIHHLHFVDRPLTFKTKSGDLTVNLSNNLYELELPLRQANPINLPEVIAHSLSIQPQEIYKARDYMLVYESEEEIKNIKINKAIFDQINLDPGGVIVTAKGNNCDFVSRYFISQSIILEDPVTGSAHCTLVPYWANKLNKNLLYAEQLSARGGKLTCKLNNNTITISGHAITYSEGTIFLN